MAGTAIHTLLDHLRRLHSVAEAAHRSDRELLHAFVNDNDQDAFAAVVTRHSPLVWGVCRRILGHDQDAEDAFQATFLILARRAGSMRWKASVGGWLHTVARRIAVRVRQRSDKRRAIEHQAGRIPQENSSLCELAVVVDEELQQLPAKYREPLLLHYLQGATAEAAARQLGLSRTAFYNRLAYGRELLRERLCRQGLSLAAPLLAASLMQEAQAAAPSLIQAVLRRTTESVPQRVAALAAEAIGATGVMKLKIGLALGLLLGAAAGGVAMLTPREPMAPIPYVDGPAEPPKADERSAQRVDRYGDPLPPGAIARLGTLRFRFDGHIQRIALTPDGKTIAAVTSTGIWFIDVASGKMIRRVRTSIASPKGDSSGGPSAGGIVSYIAFSPNRKRFAVYGWVQMAQQKFRLDLYVWEWHEDRKEWQEAHKLRDFEIAGHPAWTGWSAEGQLLTAYTGKGEIIVHEMETGRKQHFAAKDLPDVLHHSVYRCAAGKTILAAADENDAIHIFDIAAGKKCYTYQAGARVFLLALSPDCRWLASISQQAPAVQLWDLTGSKAKQTIAAGQRDLLNIVFTPDSKTLATFGTSEVQFWDMVSGQEHSRIKSEIRASNTCVAFTPDSKTMIAAAQNGGCLHQWDVATGKLKPQPEGHSSHNPGKAAFSPDGQRVATPGTFDGTVRVWNLATGRLLAQLRRSGCWVSTCAFSADGRSLFSCWGDRILTSDSDTGRELHAWKLEDPDQPKARQRGYQLHLSDDRRRLLVFSYGSAPTGWKDWLLTGWDVAARKHLFRPRLAFQGDLWIAVSADAHVLALPAYDPSKLLTGRGPMRLQDVDTGERLATFPAIGGQTGTYPLTFSPDGRLLVSVAWHTGPPPVPHDTLRVWEVLTTHELLALPTADDGPNEAAISPDGRFLAALTPKGEIILRDLRKGKELRRFRGFDAHVTSLAFSPDGRKLVSGLSNSTYLVLDVGAPPAAIGEKLGDEIAAKVWSDLAGSDAPRAFRARGKLASVPEEAIPLLRKHLRPAKAADPQLLHRLLTDLDNEQFAVREKAQEKLVKLGNLAEAALRQTLTNKPTLEVRRRVQAVLERLRDPVTQPELLQALRAVAVLEDIGTPPARRLLRELAAGAPEARLTREAKASLERLERRTKRAGSVSDG